MRGARQKRFPNYACARGNLYFYAKIFYNHLKSVGFCGIIKRLKERRKKRCLRKERFYPIKKYCKLAP